jgi:heme exporter protein C
MSAALVHPGPRTSGRGARRAMRLLGALAVASVAVTVWLGLWVTPPDVVQGNLVRLIYLHPPVAWVAYVAIAVTALASVLYLWPRTRAPGWDLLAGASGEVGVVFTGLTLLTGSIWGRPAWGVWWTWDARLTSTALLFVLLLGYLALRRVPGDDQGRRKRSAVAALVAAADVPIVHMSVLWWQTLHQPPTVLGPDLNPTIHGSMAWTLLLAFCSFTLVYVWLLLHRFRTAVAEDSWEREGLVQALEERRAEAGGAEDAPAGEPVLAER